MDKDLRHIQAHVVLNLVPGLSDRARRVAGALIEHHNLKTGRCDPSVERLATILGIDRATVLRATAELCDGDKGLRLFTRDSHRGRHGAVQYFPQWDRFEALYDACVASCSSRSKSPKGIGEIVAELGPNTSQNCDFNGRRTATQTLGKNPCKEPLRKPKGKGPGKQPSLLLPIQGGKSPDGHEKAKDAARRRISQDMEGSGKEAVFAIWQLPEATWDQAISAELKARGSGFAVLTRALATEAGGARALDEKPRGRSQPVPRRNDLGEIGEVTIGADGQEYVSMVVRNNWKLARDCLVEWKELDPVTRDRMIGDPSVAIPKRIVDRVRLTNAIRGVA